MRGLVCHIIQDGGQSLKYPRDTIKTAGMKKEVNSMRSVELQTKYKQRKLCHLFSRHDKVQLTL